MKRWIITLCSAFSCDGFNDASLYVCSAVSYFLHPCRLLVFFEKIKVSQKSKFPGLAV